MYLKPYSDIESAIKYWNLTTDEVKIKCHNNIYKDERALIDAAVLCRVLRTFEENYEEAKRKYNIIHIGHTFWDYTTWQMKYKRNTYTIEIHSSYFASQPEYITWHFGNQSCSRGDIGTYANFINSYFDDLLKQFKSYMPHDRYDAIYKNLMGICGVTY